MSTLPQLEDELDRLMTEAKKRQIILRLIGGLAVKIHSPHAAHRALKRKYPDIDFVTDKPGSKKLLSFLPEMGYAPNKSFNALNGSYRLLYYDEPRGRQIDVFIGDFHMCHSLPLTSRLLISEPTVPLAELFLSKAQIVHLNRKDVLDLLAIVLDHDVGPEDGETINSDIIATLCAKDWGLYTTISMNMQKLLDIMSQRGVELDEEQSLLVKSRLERIQEEMLKSPKTMAWKMRAKLGKRVRWYKEVEEVQRT